MDVTPKEAKILLAIRSLRPHEKVEIMADQKGRADYFIVTHTYKEIL